MTPIISCEPCLVSVCSVCALQIFAGNLASAQTHLQRVRDGHQSALRRAEIVRFGFDRRVDALGKLGIVRWLQGFPDQAIQASGSSIDEAQTLEHPVSL